MQHEQRTDWKTCYYYWADMMRIEAASLGYEFKAAAVAQNLYWKACAAYREKYGEEFSPYSDLPLRDPVTNPATRVGLDAEDVQQGDAA